MFRLDPRATQYTCLTVTVRLDPRATQCTSLTFTVPLGPRATQCTSLTFTVPLGPRATQCTCLTFTVPLGPRATQYTCLTVTVPLGPRATQYTCLTVTVRLDPRATQCTCLTFTVQLGPRATQCTSLTFTVRLGPGFPLPLLSLQFRLHMRHAIIQIFNTISSRYPMRPKPPSAQLVSRTQLDYSLARTSVTCQKIPLLRPKSDCPARHSAQLVLQTVPMALKRPKLEASTHLNQVTG
jgi:hypothetical protein